MRTLKTEEGKGSVRTAIGHGLADPKIQGNSVLKEARKGLWSKGNQVNIPERRLGYIVVTQTNSKMSAIVLERVLSSF